MLDFLRTLPEIRVDYVLVSNRDNPKYDNDLRAILLDDAEQAVARKVDLVIEAALPSVIAPLAPRLLAHSDLCAFSCTFMADADVQTAVEAACAQSGKRFCLPHGAILGLDGLTDGRTCIDDVIITTTKNGSSFGQDADATGVIFDGSAREACARFPRNVNVHAAVALAGIGFDKTKSVVIADPQSKSMHHHIAVKGQGFEWEITTKSTSLGGVTGSFTPLSAVGSVRRILGNAAIANV